MTKLEAFNATVTTTLNLVFVVILVLMIATLIVAVMTYNYIREEVSKITADIDVVRKLLKRFF